MDYSLTGSMPTVRMFGVTCTEIHVSCRECSNCSLGLIILSSTVIYSVSSFSSVLVWVLVLLTSVTLVCDAYMRYIR